MRLNTFIGICLVGLLSPLGGCAPPSMQPSAVLTSGAALSAGKRTEVAHFKHDDFVIQLVDFTWSDVTTDAGIHSCTWRWFRDGQLISQTSKQILFKSSPYTLATRRAAATLGLGQFKVETLVDDQVVATSSFDIGA